MGEGRRARPSFLTAGEGDDEEEEEEEAREEEEEQQQQQQQQQGSLAPSSSQVQFGDLLLQRLELRLSSRQDQAVQAAVRAQLLQLEAKLQAAVLALAEVVDAGLTVLSQRLPVSEERQRLDELQRQREASMWAVRRGDW
jgi:hypothetical protein